MVRLLKLYQTTVGKKAVVAVTGIILLGFIVMHAAGNLKVFVPDTEDGAPDIDVYAEFLRTMGEPLIPYCGVLWSARIILFIATVVHIATVLLLARQNRAARPVRYVQFRPTQATLSARWMLITGLLLLVFVVIHLMHFTFGRLLPSEFTEGAVYKNLYNAFGVWYMTVFYLVAMIILALHVYHGGWSLFQTLGLDNPDRNRPLRLLATALAILILLAFAAVPASFFLRLMDEPPPHEPGHALLDPLAQ